MNNDAIHEITAKELANNPMLPTTLEQNEALMELSSEFAEKAN